MKQLELFAGIGGFGLSGECAGIETVAQVEWNPFCQKVLQKNFPNAQRFGDITKFDGKPFRGTIDIISGGFPCQPYSTAGKRLGKEDERHLWPEMLRIIQEVAPRWVVGENVRGIISWNGGMVFDEVQSDLEAAGYEVQAFILPAVGVNAPHRRDRVWFIAHANECAAGSPRESGCTEGIRGEIHDEQELRGEQAEQRNGCGDVLRATSNPSEPRLPERIQAGLGGVQPQKGTSKRCVSARDNTTGDWGEFPTQSPVCRGNDGIPNRLERIAALGNAIVPQVAYQIFKAIVEYEKMNA